MDEKTYKDDQLLHAFFKSVPEEPISKVLQARIMGQIENRKEEQLARRSELHGFMAAVIISVVFLGIGIGVLFYCKILPFKFDFKFDFPALSLPQIDTGVLPLWIMIFVIAVLLLVGESYLARKYIK